MDTTDLVANMQSTFVIWATQYICAAESAIPGMQWLRFPIISQLNEMITGAILKILVKSVAMEIFFLNTAMVKNEQAQGYIDAMNNKNRLPPTATKDEYAKAQQAEVDAFRAFVFLSPQ